MRRSFTTKQRAAIFAHHGGVCHICKGPIQVGQAWEIEHFIPLAQGGSNDMENTLPAHGKCHAVKTAKDAGDTARAKRREAIHIGTKAPPKAKIISAGFPKVPREPKPSLPPKRLYA